MERLKAQLEYAEEMYDVLRRMKPNEAELAALKAQRCETCGCYHEYNAHHNATCDEDVEVGYSVDGHNPPPSFACSRWQPQEEAQP